MIRFLSSTAFWFVSYNLYIKLTINLIHLRTNLLVHNFLYIKISIQAYGGGAHLNKIFNGPTSCECEVALMYEILYIPSKTLRQNLEQDHQHCVASKTKIYNSLLNPYFLK